MEKLFYSVGEVAEMLGENSSAVRYWSNTFSRHLHPARNGKGDRRYTREDVDTLKRIHFLLKTQGLTIDGAAKALASDKRAGVDRNIKVLESLKNMRAQLEEIRKSL